MGALRASILLPTLDAERDLARLLPALAQQELDGDVEKLAIDSSSSDATRELLTRAGFRVTTISRSEFGHGRTRNELARAARAPLLVFLSQDALPQGADFLARLIAPFEDERTAGVYARVLPHEDDDPLTRRSVLDAPEASQVALTHEPRAPAASVRFNDVASAVRASVLRELPFPDVAFGEDVAWGRAACASGWRLRFEPRALVRHAHRYGMRGAYERYRVDAAFHRELDGRRLRPSMWSVLRGTAYELSRDFAFVREHGGAAHLLRAPFLRAAQVLGQYAGSR